jgi:hypothetical protein
MRNEKVPGEFVTSVTVAEILVSTGIQLIHWSHDLAFTDAVYGETYVVEAANRMASLSEILNVVYKRLPPRTLAIAVDLPDGMVAQIAINPDFEPDAAKPVSKNTGDAGEEGGVQSSIDDLPF